MRPSAGGDALAGRSRKSSLVDATTPLAGPGHGTQTTFFLANEDMMQTSTTDTDKSGGDSVYGVESLEETMGAAEDGNELEEDEEDGEGDCAGPRRSTLTGNTIMQHTGTSADREHVPTPDSTASASHPRPWRQSPTTISQPLTPLSLESPVPSASLPSSPKSTSTRSFRHSDEDSMQDDAGSQAVVSSGDEDAGSPPEMQDSAPQLIMPSIKMPSRRPFTQRGKDIGRLKVLIAGDSGKFVDVRTMVESAADRSPGVGKTSLIKSIVQICEDIVHVDPLSSNPPTLSSSQSTKRTDKSQSTSLPLTKHITEVYASTKPYPSWWSEFEESKILRRRKSMGDTVLERNLCFVDTPGYSGGMSLIEGVEPVIQYVENQIARTMSPTQISDADLLSLLTGNGGPQVDVVLYMISQRLKPIDVEFLRRLSNFTSVVPLIAKADLHAGNISSLKASIISDLHSQNIKSFYFLKTPADTASPARTPSPPYAVSSASSNDTENMDASLLMSPDYVQPLMPTELAFLVEQMFDRDTIDWLRHSTATKCLQWRNMASSRSFPIPTPRSPLAGMTPISTRIGMSTLPSLSSSSSSTSQALISYNSGGALSYTLARVTDHTQREEKLAQVRLAKWAGELQRSLQNERERYEALARGERAVWLTERLGECVVDGTLVPVDPMLTVSPHPKGTGVLYQPALRDGIGRHFAVADPHDPLGLLHLNETVKRRGWVAVQVVGSFGVIGALAMWLARSWGFGGESLGSWNWGFWGGGE